MGEYIKEKPTDPSPPPTREAIFDDLMEKVAALYQSNREMSKLILGLAEKNSQFDDAILNIQESLTMLWADGTLTREQLQPMGTRVGEMDERLGRLERRIRDSQGPKSS